MEPCLTVSSIPLSLQPPSHGSRPQSFLAHFLPCPPRLNSALLPSRGVTTTQIQAVSPLITPTVCLKADFECFQLPDSSDIIFRPSSNLSPTPASCCFIVKVATYHSLSPPRHVLACSHGQAACSHNPPLPVTLFRLTTVPLHVVRKPGLIVGDALAALGFTIADQFRLVSRKQHGFALSGCLLIWRWPTTPILRRPHWVIH